MSDPDLKPWKLGLLLNQFPRLIDQIWSTLESTRQALFYQLTLFLFSQHIKLASSFKSCVSGKDHDTFWTRLGTVFNFNDFESCQCRACIIWWGLKTLEAVSITSGVWDECGIVTSNHAFFSNSTGKLPTSHREGLKHEEHHFRQVDNCIYAYYDYSEYLRRLSC